MVSGFWESFACFGSKFQATGKLVDFWRGVLVVWAITELRPNGASAAMRNLTRQGFEFYNPVIAERVGRSFRRVQLFTNYLFVCVVDNYRAVRSTIGVKDFVFGAGAQLGVVSKDFIAALKARENDHGLVQLPRQQKFAPGQKVLTRDLLFEGIYEGQRGSERCVVLFSLLGSSRAVEMNEGDLVAA